MIMESPLLKDFFSTIWGYSLIKVLLILKLALINGGMHKGMIIPNQLPLTKEYSEWAVRIGRKASSVEVISWLFPLVFCLSPMIISQSEVRIGIEYATNVYVTSSAKYLPSFS